MESYGSTYRYLIGDSFWQAAVAQSTLETYDQAMYTTSYYGEIAKTYRQYLPGPNPVSKTYRQYLPGPNPVSKMGSVIAGLAQLYVATKNTRLLTEAEEIGTATIRRLAPNGVLADPCQPARCRGAEQSFKGIFIRDLMMLATIARSSAYDSFFRAQRSSIEVHDTSKDEQFGLIWAGPINKACTPHSTSSRTRAEANVCTSYTQASAEDAVVAAFASERQSSGKHNPVCQGALVAQGARQRPPTCHVKSPPRPSPEP
jgi:Glycosyl hydrolase family 76